MSEWRDISTAPKDGTRILAWCIGRPLVVRWDAGWNQWQSVPGKYGCHPMLWLPIEPPATSTVTAEAEPRSTEPAKA